MKTISRYIMTLALLLTAVTGAWAQSLNASELNVPDSWQNDGSTITADDLLGFVAVTIDQAKAWAGAPKTGGAILIYGFSGSDLLYVEFQNGVYNNEYNLTIMRSTLCVIKDAGAKIYYTCDAPVLTPGATAGTWTFSMPASDVVLTPQYAPAAAFATTGTEPEVKTLLPEAAEGVIAGTDASLIAEGTGIVAFAGTSTEVTQGTLMYAVGTSATEAPALTAFSATLPTAEKIAAGDVYVWYYIKGADAPQGQTATAENTFNDSEICTTPLKVTVLNNKFNIQFTAANANTIEAGKATVTVGGTAATVTEGKLEGVKMGSEVKLEAKPGYKFRKVEVKKAAALLTLSVCGQTIYYAEGETWAEAIQNHPTENQGWEIYSGDVAHDNLGFLLQNDDFVPGSAKIDPSASYDSTGM